TPGGLQAPYVTRLVYPRHATNEPARGSYAMCYGDWVDICLAGSSDGKTFNRLNCNPSDPCTAGGVGRPNGKSGMFGEGPNANTRDPMIIRIGDVWHCYYTAHPNKVGSVYCRTSPDLRIWSEATVVARGGESGTGMSSSECPFVVALDG